jgi:hypothetical protein
VLVGIYRDVAGHPVGPVFEGKTVFFCVLHVYYKEICYDARSHERKVSNKVSLTLTLLYMTSYLFPKPVFLPYILRD